MLSRLDLPPIAKLARNNGAQAFLVKSRASGDQLSMLIHKAIATVARSNARNVTQGMPSSIQRLSPVQSSPMDLRDTVKQYFALGNELFPRLRSVEGATFSRRAFIVRKINTPQ